MGLSERMSFGSSWCPCTTSLLFAERGYSLLICSSLFPVLARRWSASSRCFWFLSVCTHLVPMTFTSFGRLRICSGVKTSTVLNFSQELHSLPID